MAHVATPEIQREQLESKVIEPKRAHERVSLYPSLYQINTRVWLTDLSRKLGRPATLDDVPDYELDRLVDTGFEWIWFLSVWQTGRAGQTVSRANSEWRKEFHETLPDLRDEDIGGSGFAISDYRVHSGLGGTRLWPDCENVFKIAD
jgi:hypothetical protein